MVVGVTAAAGRIARGARSASRHPPKHTIEPAMIVAEEPQHVGTPGVRAGEADCQLHGLGSGNPEPHPLRAGDVFDDPLGKFHFQRALRRAGTDGRQAIQLAPDSVLVSGVAVAPDRRTHGEDEVDVPVAVRIEVMESLRPFQKQRFGARHGAKIALPAGHDALGAVRKGPCSVTDGRCHPEKFPGSSVWVNWFWEFPRCRRFDPGCFVRPSGNRRASLRRAQSP